MTTNHGNGATGRVEWLRRGAMRVTPLWVTIIALAVASGGTGFAWFASEQSSSRQQAAELAEQRQNCRIRNAGIRNGEIRINTFVDSFVREVGGGNEAIEAGERVRADQRALPENEYVDCNDDDDINEDDF